MADQDWCLFFGHDEVEFSTWYVSYRRRLISQIAHGFPVTLDEAVEIVDEGFRISLERPQPANLQHLQGALSITAKNVALNTIRRERRRDEIRLRFAETNVQRLREGDGVQDDRPKPEEVLADHDFYAYCLTLFTAAKALLTANGKETALKILAVIEQRGLQLKRSEMITQTGLGAEAYDAARKQVNRSLMNKDVRQQAHQQWLVRFSKQLDHDVVHRRANNDVSGNGFLIESENANANQILELVSKEFDRTFFSRK